MTQITPPVFKDPAPSEQHHSKDGRSLRSKFGLRPGVQLNLFEPKPPLGGNCPEYSWFQVSHVCVVMWPEPYAWASSFAYRCILRNYIHGHGQNSKHGLFPHKLGDAHTLICIGCMIYMPIASKEDQGPHIPHMNKCNLTAVHTVHIIYLTHCILIIIIILSYRVIIHHYIIIIIIIITYSHIYSD